MDAADGAQRDRRDLGSWISGATRPPGDTKHPFVGGEVRPEGPALAAAGLPDSINELRSHFFH